MATTPTLPEIPEIPIEKLTTSVYTGTGVVDKLMQSVHSYVDHEFKESRLKGPEYAQVCLGLIQAAMSTGLAFLMQQQKAALEAQLIQAQIRLADAQVEIALVELQIKEAELPKIEAEVRLIDKQIEKADKEILVLIAQECKLRGEYDLTMETVQKTAQETALLAAKVVTEQAQTQSVGVNLDSVIGRQKALYQAQADGFKRDAEQKVAKIMVDSWNVRRTTDEATQANDTNRLDDVTVGAAVSKLLSGVGA